MQIQDIKACGRALLIKFEESAKLEQKVIANLGRQKDLASVSERLATLDRDAGLSLVERDGLVIEDASAVAHVGVDAGGVGASARIDP